MTRPTSEQPRSELRDYTAAKFAVTDLVREALSGLQGDRHLAGRERLQDLLVRLAEDRFNLAVVGQFKRGKSSLMNAIIGRDLLPTGLLPLTSAITAVRYGPRALAMLVRQGWAFEQEVRLEELVDYVTERGNPGNEKGLLEARVEVPVAFLRRGLYFVDTPGVGSMRHENTSTTYAFLPEADAIIFVTSVDGPLSDVEESLLRELRPFANKLFVVVNKIDLLGPADREILGASTIPIHLVSTRLALEAKLTRTVDALEESGIAELEGAVDSFLANEQGRLFLMGVADRAIQGLADEADAPEGRETFAAVVRRLTAQKERLESGMLLVQTRPERSPPDGSVGIEEASAVARERGRRAEIAASSSTSGCPVCREQGRALFEFFAHWQHVIATSPEARDEFAGRRGFCSVHTWQFEQIASPVGLSAGYVALMDGTVDALMRLEGADDIAAAARALPPGIQGCAACDVLAGSGIEATAALVEPLASNDARDADERAGGLCVPDLVNTLATNTSPELARRLVDLQIERLRDTADDMRAFVLKRDAIRRGLINANEEKAWRGALVRLVGERMASGAPAQSREAVWPARSPR
jgi:GTP-binding protein EngB required for normal cell division